MSDFANAMRDHGQLPAPPPNGVPVTISQVMASNERFAANDELLATVGYAGALALGDQAEEPASLSRRQFFMNSTSLVRLAMH